MILEASAEKSTNVVQNFSWRIFWVELFTLNDGTWYKVAHGASFLNETEWNDSRLYKRQDVSVSIVNLSYFESVSRAWFRIGIMMDIYNNNTEYSLTFYTPMENIGPVSVLSPLFSPMILATISAATIATTTTLACQLPDKTNPVFKGKPSVTKRQNR